jgi:murein DD-endopeptidase MepM/ murein hydrolase activator NlpD
MGLLDVFFGGKGKRPQKAARVCIYGLGWPLEVNQIRDGSPNHLYGYIPGRRSGIHQGWDLHAFNGTPCLAVADGLCLDTWYSSTYGYCVLLATPYLGPLSVPLWPLPLWFRDRVAARGGVVPFGAEPVIYTLYAHLQTIMVRAGQPLRYRQSVGLTGSTGNARRTTPHLHFEVRQRPGDGGKYYLPGLFGRIDPRHVYGDPPLSQPVFAMAKPPCLATGSQTTRSEPRDKPRSPFGY